MKNQATIKDVAKLAGVSISTVSRVMNNSAHVENVLKERVKKAAEEVGYTPNEIARSLKRANSAMVAFVVSNTADPFFTFIGRGIEEVMYRNGYNLIYCSTNFSVEREVMILNMLKERRVAGIIINTVGKNDEVIGTMSSSIPIVLSNRSIDSVSFRGDFVDYDNIGGVRKLVEHVTAMGHKKVAMLNGPKYLSTVCERQEGFRLGMRDAGLHVDDNYPYIVNSESTFSNRDGFEGAKKVLSMDEPPTAIIAANTETALGILHYCKKAGIRIPEDVSVCCFGDIVHHELMYVNLTHVSTDLFALGNRIGEMLLQRISRQDLNQVNLELRFDTPLIVGDSTMPPKSL